MTPNYRNNDHNSWGVCDANENAVKKVHYRGVRRRPWGGYAEEIRDPTLKRGRWLDTFANGQKLTRVYEFSGRNLKGEKARTNFPAPYVDIHNQSYTATTTTNSTIFSTPHCFAQTSVNWYRRNNENKAFARSSIGKQVRPSMPWFYVNEGMGIQGLRHHNMNLNSTIATTKALIPLGIPCNIVDYATLQEQQVARGVPLSGEIVGSNIIKRLKGHQWVGVVNNVLHAAAQTVTIACASSSSSPAVDTQLSPSATRMKKTLDLNLPPPVDEDDGSPSLILSL